MHLFRTILMLLVFSFSINIHAAPQKKKQKSTGHYLCVATMFRNEAKWLKEWIEYHRLLGVDHFYLYNNLSTDNYLEVLNPYIKKKVVTLVDWPHSIASGDELCAVQNKAMHHCVISSDATWIAVIDVDEFIVPVGVDNLKNYLYPYDSMPEVGAIYINWLAFGTSNVYEIPKDKLLIETLTKREETISGIGKTIVKRQAVLKFRDSHRPFLSPDYVAIYPNQMIVDDWGVADVSNTAIIRINHYWSRDIKYFEEVKSKGVTVHAQNQGFLDLFRGDTFNRLDDREILRFVPNLRKRMNLK